MVWIEHSFDRGGRDIALRCLSNDYRFNLHTIGLILIIVGAVSLVLSIVFWNTWGGFGEPQAAAPGGSVASHRTAQADPSKKNARTSLKTAIGSQERRHTCR